MNCLLFTCRACSPTFAPQLSPLLRVLLPLAAAPAHKAPGAPSTSKPRAARRAWRRLACVSRTTARAWPACCAGADQPADAGQPAGPGVCSHLQLSQPLRHHSLQVGFGRRAGGLRKPSCSGPHRCLPVGHVEPSRVLVCVPTSPRAPRPLLQQVPVGVSGRRRRLAPRLQGGQHAAAPGVSRAAAGLRLLAGGWSSSLLPQKAAHPPPWASHPAPTLLLLACPCLRRCRPGAGAAAGGAPAAAAPPGGAPLFLWPA